MFGLDVRLPGLVYAAVIHAPVLGGKAVRIDDQKTLKSKGVRRVISLGTAVAVVADTTWQALRGAEHLDVDWDRTEAPGMDTDELKKKMARPGRPKRQGGLQSGGNAGQGCFFHGSFCSSRVFCAFPGACHPGTDELHGPRSKKIAVMSGHPPSIRTGPRKQRPP